MARECGGGGGLDPLSVMQRPLLGTKPSMHAPHTQAVRLPCKSLSAEVRSPLPPPPPSGRLFFCQQPFFALEALRAKPVGGGGVFSQNFVLSFCPYFSSRHIPQPPSRPLALSHFHYRRDFVSKFWRSNSIFNHVRNFGTV
jgi:hypothetical protein